MKLAIIEIPARFGGVAEVLKETERLLLDSSAPGVDLALLPEAALTGYVSPSGVFDLRAFAEPLDGPTVRAMSDLASRAGCTIAAPLIERDSHSKRAGYFNAFVVLSPRGELRAHYRKRHPWFPETWASPGDLPMPIFEIASVKTSLAICFDVHFLKVEQSQVLDRADLLLFPSAWDDDGPDDLRGPILSKLAKDHDLTIANANWGAGEPSVLGQGTSRVVTRAGELKRTAPTPLGESGRPQRLDVTVEIVSESGEDHE